MSESLDQLVLRFIFSLIILSLFFIYKYIHQALYPESQMLQELPGSKNPADSLHFFARVLGLGIIFSEFFFKIHQGFLFTSFDFFLRAFVAFGLYLISLYLVDSIALYDFEYNDEVVKRRNLSYSTLCLSHALGVSFNIKMILSITSENLILFAFLWLLSIVLLGFSIKIYTLTSTLNINQILYQKSSALAMSYMGFFLGSSLIISSSLNHELLEIRWYLAQVALKIILSLLIIPLFIYGFKFIFNLKDEMDDASEEDSQDLMHLNYGLCKGASFFTSCLLTVVITGKIYFESF